MGGVESPWLIFLTNIKNNLLYYILSLYFISLYIYIFLQKQYFVNQGFPFTGERYTEFVAVKENRLRFIWKAVFDKIYIVYEPAFGRIDNPKVCLPGNPDDLIKLPSVHAYCLVGHISLGNPEAAVIGTEGYGAPFPVPREGESEKHGFPFVGRISFYPDMLPVLVQEGMGIKDAKSMGIRHLDSLDRHRDKVPADPVNDYLVVVRRSIVFGCIEKGETVPRNGLFTRKSYAGIMEILVESEVDELSLSSV